MKCFKRSVAAVVCIAVLSLCSIECEAGKCCMHDLLTAPLFVFLVPTLQQTVPPGGVAVCPLSTVQYTCVADNELQWRTDVVAGYSTANQVNDTAMAGSFNTVLTDISGNTLTSTATIDSVSLGDDGRNISCREISNSVISEQTRTVQVEGKL